MRTKHILWCLERAVCAVALLEVLGCAACTYHGRYAIRGTVHGVAAGREVAVPGASVIVASQDAKSGWPGKTTTDTRGDFEAFYQYGGLFVPGLLRDGDPVVQIAATGFSECRIEVHAAGKRTRAPSGKCAPNERFCFEFDVLLKPTGASHGVACEY